MTKQLKITLIALMVCLFSSQLYAAACDNPVDASIKNSCIVSPNVLWRGAKPDALAAASLMAHGVKTVVNLELLNDDMGAFSDALSHSESGTDSKSASTIQYFRVHDWEPLIALSHRKVDQHVAQFIAITRSQPTPIYVHCRSGRNRTGVMVAAYQVFNGTPIEEAVADMKRYKGEWFKQDAKYIRTLTSARIAELESQITIAQASLKTEAEIHCNDGHCRIIKD